MGIRFILEEQEQAKPLLFKSNKNKLDNGKDNKLILLVPEQYTLILKEVLDIVTERTFKGDY